jgi:ATP-binding cassette subfamily B protein
MLSQWNTIIDMIMVEILSTLLYIVGANLVFDLQLSVGSVFAFVTYSAYVTGPISAILNIGYLLSGIIPSTKRYYEFMGLQEETDNGKITESVYGDIKIENVSFAYVEDKFVLRNADIVFAKGSKNALIGRNGSGKSTIINLLTRIYEPTSGTILLNGVDIFKISLQEYRNMVSVVSQQTYLFNDTIRNNICLYKQVSDEEIIAACKDSGLEEFLQEVALDYKVGQNGAMLSGGQKQKIAFARALIHNKPIIIFDEATSNTDAYSEQQINGLLHTRLKDKTVIIISHKKEILNEVDQIIILEEGQITDIGGYQALSDKIEKLSNVSNKPE